MTRARVQLAVAAGLFAGWLGWLGYAVTQRGTVPVVSRAQVAGAAHLVVAEVAAGPDGRPLPTATVAEVLRGDLHAGDRIEVANLPAARTPRGEAVAAGTYLLALGGDGPAYRVAGLPRSPGIDPADGAGRGPVVYPWGDDVGVQVRRMLP